MITIIITIIILNIITKLLKTFIRFRHLRLVCCSTLVLFNRTILTCSLNVSDINFSPRNFLQKNVWNRIQKQESEDFCWIFHTVFIHKGPLSWHICRNRQLEGISVVAQQFHETLEPLNEWLTTIEKRLANCEPIGTQASKLEEQIAQHKVRYSSHVSKILFSIPFLVLWHKFELCIIFFMSNCELNSFQMSTLHSIYVFIFICPFCLFLFLKTLFRP